MTYGRLLTWFIVDGERRLVESGNVNNKVDVRIGRHMRAYDNNDQTYSLAKVLTNSKLICLTIQTVNGSFTECWSNANSE